MQSNLNFPVHIVLTDRWTQTCAFNIKLKYRYLSKFSFKTELKLQLTFTKTQGTIVLADVIDSDSWRLWPSGDKRLMKDKQVYRDMQQVTPEALDQVKRNFQWVADRVKVSILPDAKLKGKKITHLIAQNRTHQVKSNVAI